MATLVALQHVRGCHLRNCLHVGLGWGHSRRQRSRLQCDSEKQRMRNIPAVANLAGSGCMSMQCNPISAGQEVKCEMVDGGWQMRDAAQASCAGRAWARRGGKVYHVTVPLLGRQPNI